MKGRRERGRGRREGEAGGWREEIIGEREIEKGVEGEAGGWREDVRGERDRERGRQEDGGRR